MFLFEQHAGASSWKERCVENVRRQSGVQCITGTLSRLESQRGERDSKEERASCATVSASAVL